MKKNYSLFCLTLLLAVYVSSCSSEPELVFDETQDEIHMKVWEVKRKIHDPKASSYGDQIITGDGDLEYLLKSLHNSDDADLDISELSNKNKGYKVEVKTSGERVVKHSINQSIANWLTVADYEVYYGQKESEIYSLSIENESLLLENLYQSTDGRTNYLKTTKQELLLQGPLKQLASTLEKQESSKPIELLISDDLNNQLFTITLSRNDGIEGIIEQLSTNYGIGIQKVTRNRKVLKVK